MIGSLDIMEVTNKLNHVYVRIILVFKNLHGFEYMHSINHFTFMHFVFILLLICTI